MTSGGGRSYVFCPGNFGPTCGRRRSSLNTGCIFHEAGSLSLYAEAPNFSTISKGPRCFSASLVDGRRRLRFRASRRTLSPGSYLTGARLVRLYASFMRSWACLKPSFAFSQYVVMAFANFSAASQLVDILIRGSKPFQGCVPVVRKKGENPVVLFRWSLYVNSAKGSCCAQSSWS